MISWIQNQFQRHFRIVFLVLLAVVIVAFVFTIGAAPGIGRAERAALSRTFYGVNLGSPEEADRLFGDATLSVVLQAGFQALQGAQLQEYALQRHAGLHLADRLSLPRPTREQLAQFIRGLRAFSGPNGEFDPNAYQRFRDNMRTNAQVNEATLARVLADEYRYDQVQKLLGGPGYVLDHQVTDQIARADTNWQVNVATINYASFQPTIEPTEAELRSYFENNAFRYEVPAQVRVSYVEFPATQFLDRVNVTEEEVRNYYYQNPARFPNPATANEQKPAVTPEDATEEDFTAVRNQVESALRLERARRLAGRAASDLTVVLFEAKATPANVEPQLQSRGLSLQAAQPFARGSAPAFLGGNPQLAAEAFRLSAERPISDALITPNGAVVLIWQETIPAHPAEFANVQSRVREDYLENQRRQQFAALGRRLRESVQSRMQNGQTFAAALAAEAEASKVQVDTKSYGPFPRREPPQDLPYPAVNAMERLEQGQVSEMVLTGDQGLIVHAASKQAPDVAPGHPRFQEMRTQLAQFHAARNADQILQDMVRTELARTDPSVAR